MPADIRTPATDQFEKIVDKAMDTLGDVAGRPKTRPDVWPIRVAKWGTEFRNWPAA